jgi:hypothetical protein
MRWIELGLVAFGVTVSAASSYFAWQAASYTAEQAKYAQQALNASDFNQSFRTYIASWNRLCEAINPPEYKLIVSTPFYDAAEEFIVMVTNHGFDRALFDIDAHNKRVNEADKNVRDDMLALRTFMPAGSKLVPQQASNVTGFFFVWNLEEEGSNDLKKRLVRAAALCRYYTEEQLEWFRDRNHTTKPVLHLWDGMKIEHLLDQPPTPKPR